VLFGFLRRLLAEVTELKWRALSSDPEADWITIKRIIQATQSGPGCVPGPLVFTADLVATPCVILGQFQ